MAGDGDDCDRKSRRFAIAIFGALRYPVLRSEPQRWIPELRFGYPPLRKFQNRSGRNSEFFSKVPWQPSTPLIKGVEVHPPGHPEFPPSKPKENKLSRERANFSTSTPSRGRPPPLLAGSGPKKLIFVLFFSCLTLGERKLGWPRTTLGCSPPLDARELLTRGIPEPMNFWGIPELRLTIPVGSAKEALDPESSTQEFLD